MPENITASQPGSSRPITFWPGVAWAMFAGLLQVLSWPNFLFPEFSLWNGYLVFISMIPFLWVWRRANWKQLLLFGGSMGAVYMGGCLYWVLFINNRLMEMENIIVWSLPTLLCAVYYGLFGALTKIIHEQQPIPESFLLPLGWTAMEYIRGHLIAGGLPWGSLGHTQYSHAIIRQLAAVAGVSGISFLIVWVNVLLWHAWEKRRLFFFHWLPPAEIGKKIWNKFCLHPLVSLGLGSWIIFSLGLLGLLAEEMLRFSRTPHYPLQVALIQSNIITGLSWDSSYQASVMQAMHRLHQQAAQRKPDLIVWAESCFPAALKFDLEYQWEEQLQKLVSSFGIPTVLTSDEYEKTYQLEGKAYREFNSAFCMDGQGRIIGQYRKIKLVPIGEYVPHGLEMILKPSQPLEIEPGQDYSIFPFYPYPFATLICYEDHFEELGFRFAQAGAGFFLALINESWVRLSAMHFQHAAMSVFLAVENRAFVARAAMTGPTCVIDPWGHWKQTLPLYTSGVEFATIFITHFKPFFSRQGNLFPFICCLVFFILLLATGIKFIIAFYAQGLKPGEKKGFS